jgi:hypothetical protein
MTWCGIQNCVSLAGISRSWRSMTGLMRPSPRSTRWDPDADALQTDLVPYAKAMHSLPIPNPDPIPYARQVKSRDAHDDLVEGLDF